MSQIKQELRSMFESCSTYPEIFNMISIAVKKGYSPEEANTAASWRKNRLVKDTQKSFKRIDRRDIQTVKSTSFATLPVVIKNLSSPVIVFTGSEFII